jgi:hypothetical protein
VGIDEVLFEEPGGEARHRARGSCPDVTAAGMLLAAGGYLPPVAGALAQEAIDVAPVLNALRVALPTNGLRDEGV